MKYIIIDAAVLLLCIFAAVVITKQIAKKTKLSKPAQVFCTVFLSVVFLILSVLSYFAVHYRAQDTARSAMEGNDSVNVKTFKSAWLFDGPGTETVFVFYPGTKVESQAYAPLMNEIAGQGTDCVLLDPPLLFALFDQDGIRRAYKNASYENWYIGGHSLGGLIGGMYAARHPEEIAGVVMLGSYPAAKLSDERLLLIYGSEDGCLSRNDYENSRADWPDGTREYVIPGGNHSGFGDYGLQSGDREASISPAEQQKLTAEQIIAFTQQ